MPHRLYYSTYNFGRITFFGQLQKEPHIDPYFHHKDILQKFSFHYQAHKRALQGFPWVKVSNLI